jgi:hypothetical protein
VDAPLFKTVDEIRWRGPTPEFEAWCIVNKGDRLLARVRKLAAS